MPRKKQNAWIPHQVRDDGRELYFSELYVLSGGYLLPLWFYVSFYSPFYLPFCIVDFQVFIVVICLFICNYLPFYSPFTNL